MDVWALNGLRQFLEEYRGMSIAPIINNDICLRGKFRFIANISGNEELEDSYKLEIVIPSDFPKAIPTVKEVGGKIPQNGDFHVNPDGSLCLGSPMRLLETIQKYPSLVGFAEKCIVPYLYAVSYKKQKQGKFVFGELKHGVVGVIDDYKKLFGMDSVKDVYDILYILASNKHNVKTMACPCGCGKKLKKCSFNNRIKEMRRLASQSWYEQHLKELMLNKDIK